MAMSNTYGNTPRPPHDGMREMPDQDREMPESMPDCEKAAADMTAHHEAQSRKLMMGMGER